MKANELRIGTLIIKSLKSGNGRKIIDKVGVQDIVRISENTGSFNYEAIQLKEWLVKFRWQLIKNKTFYINSYFSIDEYGHLYYCGDYTGINLDYVHQLQNLYYALTGEELTISNKTL